MKEIACHYLKTFFFIDLVSGIPFGIIFQDGGVASVNKLVRVLKLPKLARMLRIAKLLKFDNMVLTKKLQYLTRIYRNKFKVIALAICTITLIHIATCIWCYIGFDEEDVIKTWIDRHGFRNLSNSQVYLRGMYFTITALLTIGYGDVSALTNCRPCSTR